MATAAFQDHYSVLQVTPNTALEDIKKAYRSLALKHHPDKNIRKQDATKRFQQIAAAWEILSDPEQRAKYDNIYRTHHAHIPRSHNTSYPRSYQQGPQDGSTRTQEWQWKGANESTEDDIRKRQEWDTWLRNQNIQIDGVERTINKLRSELERLYRADREYTERLAKENSWWNLLSPWSSSGLTEKEMQNMEQERIQRMAAKRVKEAKLSSFATQLESLQKEKRDKSAKENERKEKVRQERSRKEDERRERYRQEQQREEAERERKEFAEFLRRDAERRDKERRERERRDTERREREKERQERERQEKERLARLQEEIRRQQRTQRQAEQKKNRKDAPNRPGPSPSTCRHRIYWDKIEGREVCSHCQQMQNRFLYQCSLCKTMGCAICMKAMKLGTI